MNELKKTSLGEFAGPGRSVISGPFGSNIGTKFFRDSGIPLIRGNNLTTDYRKFIDSGFVYVSEEKADEVKSDAYPGDLLFTAAGTIGQVGMIPPDPKFPRYVISNKQLRFRVDPEKADALFLFYWLASPWIHETIIQRNTGSTVPLINLSTIRGLPVWAPPLSTQKKIAKVLATLDAKIELNNRINAELEAMAKLLYDYWFVQFDFPMTAAQAAALGQAQLEGQPYKSSGGKMVFNPTLKHEIPEGWDVGTLEEFISHDKTGDWGKEASHGNYTEKVSCIRGTDLNSLNGKGLTTPPSRYILAKNKHKMLAPDDVIIEISGGSPTQSTGRAGLITDQVLERFSDPLICSNFCKAIRISKTEHTHYFMQTWSQLYDIGVLFCWEGKTSGIKNLLFDSFLEHYYICIPPADLIKQFHQLAKSKHAQIQNLLKQNQELTTLRDWLLPILMNGQVTVKD